MLVLGPSPRSHRGTPRLAGIPRPHHTSRPQVLHRVEQGLSRIARAPAELALRLAGVEVPEALRHLDAHLIQSRNPPDETDRAIELRARDRHRKLIAKIDAALRHIEAGTYGYCAETGEPITLKRLEARPITTLSFEAQQRHERREQVYRDD